MPGRADRVAHVVQAVEGGDQVVAACPAKSWALAISKSIRSATPASAARLRASSIDSVVVVAAHEPRLWGSARRAGWSRRRARSRRRRPWPRPRSLASTPSSAGIQRGHQVGEVAGPEELLAADEDLVVVLVPAHTGAGAERLLDPVDRLQRAERQHEGAGRVDRAVGVRQHEGLLLGHRPDVALGVVGDVATGGLARAATRRRTAGRSRSAGPGRRPCPAPRPAPGTSPSRCPRTTPPAVIVAPEVTDEAPQHLVQLVVVHVDVPPGPAGAVRGRGRGRDPVYERRREGRDIRGNPYGTEGRRPAAAAHAATPARLGTPSRDMTVAARASRRSSR